MSQLVCPLCSESLKDEGAHFFKHFKYKRYACGTNNCDHQFYTEADREVHCTTHNHKRSFQKTVNPYIDKMIEMIVHDARELATTGMDTVIENRFGDVVMAQNASRIQRTPSKESVSTPSSSAASAIGKKRTTAATSSSTTTPAPKKKKTSGAATATATVSRGRGSNASPPQETSGAPTSSPARSPAVPVVAAPPVQRVRTSSNVRAPPTPTSSSTSSVAQPPTPQPAVAAAVVVMNSSSEVDSTTSDHNLHNPVEKQQQQQPATKQPTSTRQRKKPSESSTGSGAGGGGGAGASGAEMVHNRSYESMTAAEKLTGFYDRNAPGLADALKTTCTACKKDIVIDFLVRMEHTTSQHMAADVAEEDYNEILRAEMDRCYPEHSNSKLACQQCVNGPDIIKSRRREHIESKHHTSLQDLSALKCPIEACGSAFTRQCKLSTHMMENHRIQMSHHKDIDFQYNRARRNRLLDATLKICFPWSEVEKIEHTGTTGNDSMRSLASASSSFNLNTDVRLRDASRIRRAAHYNQKDTDSTDSDDSDAEDETATTTTSDKQKRSHIEEQDVIFIGRKFNEEVIERLRLQRAGSAQVKQEVVENGDVAVQQNGGFVAGEPPKEEAPDATVEENPSLSTRYAIPMVVSSYEPIVPPPATGSPDPVVATPSLFALHSQSAARSPTDDNSNGPPPAAEQPMKESPRSVSTPWSPSRTTGNSYRSQENGASSSSSSRPRISYYENRNGATGASWNRSEGGSSSSSFNNNNTNSSYQRPYSSNSNHSYRPSSTYRGQGAYSSSSSSSSRYGSTAYSSRNYNGNADSGASTSSSSSRHRDQNPSRILSANSNSNRFISNRISDRNRSSRY